MMRGSEGVGEIAGVALVSVGPRCRGGEGPTSCKSTSWRSIMRQSLPLLLQHLRSVHSKLSKVLIRLSLNDVFAYCARFLLYLPSSARCCVCFCVLDRDVAQVRSYFHLPSKQSRASPCVSRLMKASSAATRPFRGMKRPAVSTVFGQAAMDVVSRGR